MPVLSLFSASAICLNSRNAAASVNCNFQNAIAHGPATHCAACIGQTVACRCFCHSPLNFPPKRPGARQTRQTNVSISARIAHFCERDPRGPFHATRYNMDNSARPSFIINFNRFGHSVAFIMRWFIYVRRI